MKRNARILLKDRNIVSKIYQKNASCVYLSARSVLGERKKLCKKGKVSNIRHKDKYFSLRASVTWWILCKKGEVSNIRQKDKYFSLRASVTWWILCKKGEFSNIRQKDKNTFPCEPVWFGEFDAYSELLQGTGSIGNVLQRRHFALFGRIVAPLKHWAGDVIFLKYSPTARTESHP
jgi:hypothetical protein